MVFKPCPEGETDPTYIFGKGANAKSNKFNYAKYALYNFATTLDGTKMQFLSPLSGSRQSKEACFFIEQLSRDVDSYSLVRQYPPHRPLIFPSLSCTEERVPSVHSLLGSRMGVLSLVQTCVHQLQGAPLAGQRCTTTTRIGLSSLLHVSTRLLQTKMANSTRRNAVACVLLFFATSLDVRGTA